MPDRPTPLIRYLRVQESFERDMIPILDQAYENANRVLKKLESDERIGATIRRRQLRAAQAEIKRELATLWTRVGSTVVARREEAAAAAIDSIYDPLRPMLTAAGVAGASQEALVRAEQAFAKRNIANVATRQTLSQIPLSERVYRSQRLVSGQVDRLVNRHLARGTSARELAKDVREFIRPDVQGGVRYASMRLGRTELNNAFHGTQVQAGIRNPMVEAQKWNLSGSHPRPDECNDYAEGGDLGDGLWTPDQVPSKPHPNCLCYMTAKVPSREQFIQQFQAGAYDSYIDDFIEGREPPIRVSTAPPKVQQDNPLRTRKNATLDSPAQWTGDRKERIISQPYYARETVGNGMLNQMFVEQGWVGAMDELDGFAFDALVQQEGLKTVSRGVVSSPTLDKTPYDLHQAFVHEDSPWIGSGYSGSGWYSGSHETAMQYAGFDESGVLQMAFKPDAKIVKFDDLTKMVNDRFDEFFNLGLYDLTADHGMLATMLGYDAIDVDGAIHVILNRSAMIARKMTPP